MATEVLYATSHLAGDFLNPGNAVGNTPGNWAGQLDTSTSSTSRWAIGNPVDPLTTGATQTIRVRARKGVNSGNPTIQLNLYESGALVSSISAAVSVTSTTSQIVVGSFDSSAISNRNNVEIEVVQTATGGSPSARNSAQISYIEWTADTGVAAPIEKAATLVYDFVTDDGTFINAVAGGSITGGVASMPYTTGSTVKQTAVNYDLTDSTVFVECVHNAAHASNESRFVFGGPGGFFLPSQFQFVIVSASLFLREVDAFETPSDVEIVYNATTMRWLRFRHSGTSIFWDTSPDGSTWTQRRTKTATFTPSAHRIKVGGFNFQASQATAATFDNINGGISGGTGELAATLPALTASLTAQAATTGTLSGQLPAVTASIQGTASATAALGVTLPELVGSFTADNSATATLAGVLPALTGSLTADVTGTATLAGTLPELAAGITGQASATGSFGGVLPTLTAGLTATVSANATLAGVFPELEAEITGQASSEAVLAGAFPELEAAFIAEAESPGAILAGGFPEPETAITAHASTDATMSGVFPELIAGFTGQATSEAVLAGTLPELIAALSAAASSDAVLAGVLPELTAEITLAPPFTSIAGIIIFDVTGAAVSRPYEITGMNTARAATGVGTARAAHGPGIATPPATMGVKVRPNIRGPGFGDREELTGVGTSRAITGVGV